MRIVSVLHPLATQLPPAADVGAGEHLIVVPRGVAGPGGVAEPEMVLLRQRGWPEFRLARYAALRPVLAGADIVHLRAHPATALAYHVAHLCRPAAGGAVLIIECGHAGSQTPPLFWRMLARRVLIRADAVVARHANGLAALRALGFTGAGLIGGAPAHVAPPHRRYRTGPLTLGLAARYDAAGNGATDVLEAVAASPSVHLVAAASAGYQRLADRAAALEMQDRIRFVPAADLLAECDMLAAVPHPQGAYDLPFDSLIASAQAQCMPVLCSDVAGLPEMAGGGGWVVPPGDAGAIFEVLRSLRATPELLEQAGHRAAAHGKARYLQPLSGSVLHRAMEYRAARRNAATPSGQSGAFRRQAQP